MNHSKHHVVHRWHLKIAFIWKKKNKKKWYLGFSVLTVNVDIINKYQMLDRSKILVSSFYTGILFLTSSYAFLYFETLNISCHFITRRMLKDTSNVL